MSEEEFEIVENCFMCDKTTQEFDNDLQKNICSDCQLKVVFIKQKIMEKTLTLLRRE